MVDSLAVKLRPFFTVVFGSMSGYICIAFLNPESRKMTEHWFEWPTQGNEIIEAIEANQKDMDIYFCPQIFHSKDYRHSDGRRGARVKENVKYCPTVWADLDTCHPDSLLASPSAILETSYQRYQALWVFEDPESPAVGEDISRRIAYYHAHEGADKSGWDLTQLLRVPGTVNHKYEVAMAVELRALNQNRYRADDFKAYPEAHASRHAVIPFPTELPQKSAVEILEHHKRRLNALVWGLFTQVPGVNEYEEGWSGALWKLLMYLYEAGLEREEVLVVAKQAGCNKYARDSRPDEDLWNDVVRAYFKHQELIKTTVVPELVHVDLLTDEEVALVKERETFVDRYIKWASGLGDAATQYHQAGAFIILSALLAGKVVLPTSFGNIVPNLWYMILADTTVTRKSTSMDIATDLLIEVDSDAIMATDGSIEGLLTGLSMRPGRSSIFLRDEFSGLLEAFTKKDYMAGMAETLTKLYDGKFSKRILRRETVEIRDPILILFAGGIRTRIQQLLTLDHVSSGFMPRFVYITAESDVSKIKPMGPPVVQDKSKRNELLAEMRSMFLHYNQPHDIATEGVKVGAPSKVKAELTPQAWARFNKFESQMLESGITSDKPELLTPVYDRLGKSTLKAALLMAAAEQKTRTVIVDEAHILHAIYFASDWRKYAIEVINGVGKSSHEREIERMCVMIKKRPGVSKSALMQSFHLTAHQANSLFETMVQRGLITVVKQGHGYTYYPAGHSKATNATS